MRNTQKKKTNDNIKGCSSYIEASVIIIIDASNHTKEEWKYITLKWLQLYYNKIYILHPQHIKVYYMLTHGDFTLTSLNQDPLKSDLASDSFIENLNQLSIPNACKLSNIIIFCICKQIFFILVNLCIIIIHVCILYKSHFLSFDSFLLSLA